MKQKPHHSALLASRIFAALFVLLCVGMGATEIVMLTDNVPNNAFSHVADYYHRKYEWFAEAVVGVFALLVIFWVTVLRHWFQRGYWWKPAAWKDEEKDKS